MFKPFAKMAARTVACCAAILVMAHAARAQQPPPATDAPILPSASPQSEADKDLRARIERLERQNQELMHAMERVQAEGTQRNTVVPASTQAPAVGADVKNQSEAAIKKDGDGQTAKEPEWYQVGSIMDVTAKFNQYGNLWLSTPNNDFTMHIGAWVQVDNVFWDQSGGLRLAPSGKSGPTQGIASGVAQGGIGDLEDGTYFRRIRPFMEGTLWENFEYRLNLALENEQFETSGLDEFWVAMNKIPLIGTARIGHIKNAMGLEGDMTSSSRTMTFMERSSYSESIELNQNFVTGVWFGNSFFDQHMTYSFAAFRPDQAQSTAAFFGDGQYGLQGRLTFLPLYDDNGRQYLHLGVSGGWRNGTNNLATSSYRTFDLRARPELRDDDPAGSASDPQALPDADSTRMVDTGTIAAPNDYLMGLEALYVRGPLSFQAEYGWNWIDGATGIAPAGFKFNPALTSPQDYVFSGGYVQVAYTLTGESRSYNRESGFLTRQYFADGPFTNAWLVRDENGHLCWGLGAWEIAARYSYVDLNDGVGKNRIQGGIMNGVSIALNWYLNSNVSWMFDWVYDARQDVPTGSYPGYTSGFGTRVQLSF
jgi:phosphate-selective porin OprO/OprP